MGDLHVLVLAAGYGTRLRPLTDHIPKPMVPLLDRTLLQFQLGRLGTLAKAQLHANAHHHADLLEAHATELGMRVWREEPEILGTGGPLERMWSSGLRGEILVLNCDNWHTYDLQAFLERARDSGFPYALLATHDPHVDTLEIKDDLLVGVRGRWGREGEMRRTFTGISWYSSEAWSQIQKCERDIREFWKRGALQDEIPGWVDSSQDSLDWFDVGTSEGLYRANFRELEERGLAQWLSPAARIEGCAEASIVCAGAYVPQNTRVIASLLLPGASLVPGETVTHAVAGDGFRWII